MRPVVLAFLSCVALCAWVHAADSGSTPQKPAPPPTPPERVEVTATRIPESVDVLPTSMTIITGEDLRRRGVTDLRAALALVPGTDIAPGGDSGPAGSVPELWGLKEFDAFLLVVDGVPWGGAFVPALSTLDLNDVDRIEVLKGPAPVMYGATSFVGVIHVIHERAGSPGARAGAETGSYGSGQISGRAPLPAWGRLSSSISGQVGQTGFREDRTEVERGRLSWRGAIPAGEGTVGLIAEGVWQRQDPTSPHPRAGAELSRDIPLGANHNPSDAHIDEQRIRLSATHDRPWSRGRWSSVASVTRSQGDALRGFLTDISTTFPNARGFEQDTDITEMYVDTHLTFAGARRWQGLIGLDYMGGRGEAEGEDFDYGIGLDGDSPPGVEDVTFETRQRLRDDRGFSGAYGQVEFMPGDRWRLQAGARLNHTSERLTSRFLDLATAEREGDESSQTILRGSGSAGATFTAWRRGADALHLFGSYSNTFKPAVVDFGFEEDAEAEILGPETAGSWQAGARATLGSGRASVEVAGFLMNMRNLVVSQVENGLPDLANAGEERFKGVEATSDWRVSAANTWRISYAWHDARFTDYLTEFDGVPAQLRGNRLEMSPHHLASTGWLYAPRKGWGASAQVQFVGSRYLNKRNTALAPQYTTWSSGVGYRADDWELRVDGTNLNDQRPPTAESELGDAQYYRLFARRVDLRFIWRFAG